MRDVLSSELSGAMTGSRSYRDTGRGLLWPGQLDSELNNPLRSYS